MSDEITEHDQKVLDELDEAFKKLELAEKNLADFKRMRKLLEEI